MTPNQFERAKEENAPKPRERAVHGQTTAATERAKKGNAPIPRKRADVS